MSPRRRPSGQRRYPRTARLNHLFHEILAEELELIDDPRLEMVTVMSVETDPELSGATLYFTTLGGAEDDEEALAALSQYRVRLQGAIARQARVKHVPELTFRLDEVARSAARIDAILQGLPETRSGAEVSDPDGKGELVADPPGPEA